MNRRKIIFRADAGSDSGMGHFMRCLGMAQMLNDQYDRIFALVEPTPYMEQVLARNQIGRLNLEKAEKNYDALAKELEKLTDQKQVIIVLDGYSFTETYQKTLKDLGVALVYIDDLIKPGQVADVIINPSDSVSAADYLRSGNSKIYCGHDYALLRKSFILAARGFQRAPLTGVRSVFVCFGAADPQNVSARVIRTMKNLSKETKIHFVSSQVNENLPMIEKENKNNPQVIIHADLAETDLCTLIKGCDLAVCAPSTVAQECAAVGIPMLCLLAADNQKGIYDSLVKNQLCEGLGDADSITDEKLTKNILSASADLTKLNEQVVQQKKWFDGKAPERIRKIIEGL